MKRRLPQLTVGWRFRQSPAHSTLPKTLTIPKSRMSLPPELLDEIFSYLPLDYCKRPLRECSLVSKSWLEPSRRRLFSSVSINSFTYQPWLDNISPENIGLLRHVRSLTYSTEPYGRLDNPPGVYNLRDYFPSFRQLTTLTLWCMEIEETIPDHLEIFSAFQYTLLSLSLDDVSITWSAFVALVGCFPRLRRLKIKETDFEADDGPVPELPHALHGGLVVDLSEGDAELFADRFPRLRQEYERFEICEGYEPRLVAAVEVNVKSLKIDGCKRTSLQCVWR